MPPVIHPASIEIVVPAHNEAARLPEGLAALCRKAVTLPLHTAILVVDSASTDETGRLVREWPAGPVPVGLLRCEQPGKGTAVRAGLLATQAPFVGYCDADMATDLSALDAALRLLAAGDRLVIGSRALPASVVEARHNATRRVGATAFRALARRVVPGATDTQCGFKFFSGPLATAGRGAASHGRVRVRRRADSQLPAARRHSDRDPRPLAGHAELDVLGAAALRGRVPRRRRALAADADLRHRPGGMESAAARGTRTAPGRSHHVSRLPGLAAPERRGP